MSVNQSKIFKMLSRSVQILFGGLLVTKAASEVTVERNVEAGASEHIGVAMKAAEAGYDKYSSLHDKEASFVPGESNLVNFSQWLFGLEPNALAS